eukprot:290981-Rhodomonas_salina.1
MLSPDRLLPSVTAFRVQGAAAVALGACLEHGGRVGRRLYEDLDGDVEAGCDGDHDVLAEYGGGDEDPEDVVEECERKQRGRHLQARQPACGGGEEQGERR